jgi:hypothetical protein
MPAQPKSAPVTYPSRAVNAFSVRLGLGGSSRTSLRGCPGRPVDRREWHAEKKHPVRLALWPLHENRANIAVLKLHGLWLVVTAHDHGVWQDCHSLRRVPLPATAQCVSHSLILRGLRHTHRLAVVIADAEVHSL